MNCRLILFLSAIVLLNVSSCMQDHPNTSDITKEINVFAFIEGASNSKLKTRASNSSWDKNDEIGLFMMKGNTTLTSSALASNAKYVTKEGTSFFSPALSHEIHFPFHEEMVDFIAYYPYKETLDNLNYSIDVSDQSTLERIDLLYANNVKGVVSSNKDVNLTFKHQLCKVVLNISKEEGGLDLDGLKAEITNQNTKATFSLANGTISNENEPANISFSVSSDGALAQAILLPTASLIDKKLKLTLGTSTYSYDLGENKTIKSFDASTKYTLKVGLKAGIGVTVENVTTTIEDWLEGPTEDITAEEELQNQPDNPPEELPGEEPQEGDGSEANPYTVDQAQMIAEEKKVWVQGYIVGYYTGSKKKTFFNGILNARSLNIAIASSAVEDDPNMTFQIDLLNNAHKDIKEKIDLKNNPKNFLKKIALFGNIENYVEETMLKDVKSAIIDGVKIGDSR